MKVASLLLLFLIIGCGAPTPTPIPNLNTTAGYRQALIEHAGLASDAVDAAKSACSEDPRPTCGSVLTEQTRLFDEFATWIRTTPAPKVCVALLSGYLGLMDNGEAFFDTIQLAVDNGASGRLQVVNDRYTAYTTGKGVADTPIPNDACK